MTDDDPWTPDVDVGHDHYLHPDEDDDEEYPR